MKSERREENREIARMLDLVGERLAKQRASPFRVNAYHTGAAIVRSLAEPVAELLEREGEAGLRALPHVGPSLTSAIAELVHTGRLRLLDRLEGELCPEQLLASVPGIGPTLAHRIHETLGVETLEALEVAAHDGRLMALPGLGKRRVTAIAAVLASMLRSRIHSSETLEAREHGGAAERLRPPIGDLLEVDARYRAAARDGKLPRIAPRRFNPRGEAWLPILHTEIGDFHYTALFSNTARAHRLGHTHDWVVIFFERDGEEDQCTVVDEHQGMLQGLRVVRGREAECLRHHEVAGGARRTGTS